MASSNSVKMWILAIAVLLTAQGVNAGCSFPGNAQVTIEGGLQKRMADLNLGDKVAVGNGKYSEVTMFTHRLEEGSYEFVELQTTFGALRATTGHYIYASGKYITAGEVKIGDMLELEDGTQRAVTDVKTVIDIGLYNPQTAHGDILVNGVRASTFNVDRRFAQAIQSPLRTMFARLGLSYNAYESGACMIANSVSGGSIVA